MVSQNDTAPEVLARKRILVLGAGAIGSHIAWMLTTLGIHKISVLDFDVVEKSNLNRQLLYEEADIGKFKAEALREHLLSANSEIEVTAYVDKITSEEQLKKYVSGGFDFVVRAIDTPFQSVEWLNEVCVELKIPYTSGGFMEYYGIIGPTYIPGITPCYSCYENESHQQERLYGTGPTVSMLTEYVASKVAFEVVNVLTRGSGSCSGQMEVYDSVKNTVKHETLAHNHKCNICGRAGEKKRRSKDLVFWPTLYLLLVSILGFLVSTKGWSGYNTFIALLVLALVTLAFDNDFDAYRISFLGGTLYGFVSVALTFRLHGSIFGESSYLAAQVVNLGLQILLIISIAIVIFVMLSFFFRSVMRLIRNHAKEMSIFVR